MVEQNIQSDPSNLTELKINPEALAILEGASAEHFSKPLEELDYQQAMRIVAALMGSMAKAGKGRVASADRVVVDSREDGQQAFTGAVQNFTKELLPTIDDSGELRILVIGKQSFVNAILRRPPKVERELRFHDEPPSLIS